MNAIEINNLEFGYGDSLILKNITFNVREGEFLSIIGPNGSGKSTLLKTLNRLTQIKNGSILIDNINIEEYKSKDLAKKIALVPQDTTMDYEFTVEDVVAMGRHPYKGRFERENQEDKDIVYEAMEMTNTLKLKDRLITEISGGERQRVFIAKALSQKTNIIFLDEPTSHLDINHQMDVLNLLKKLNKDRNLTIVLVIHDINMAARYSDEIILLNHGIIQGKGSPDEVITADNLEAAYNINVIVEKSKYTNTPYLIPIEVRPRLDKNEIKKVHIISGGGSGEEVINKLYYQGHKLSLGVLNVGDSDWNLARTLRLKVIEEVPFNGISEKSYTKNIEKIKDSDIIVITMVPIGPGNLLNLMAGLEALRMGKTVYMVGRNEYEEYDYTSGQATSVLNQMKTLGLRLVEELDDLII